MTIRSGYVSLGDVQAFRVNEQTDDFEVQLFSPLPASSWERLISFIRRLLR